MIIIIFSNLSVPFGYRSASIQLLHWKHNQLLEWKVWDIKFMHSGNGLFGNNDEPWWSALFKKKGVFYRHLSIVFVHSHKRWRAHIWTLVLYVTAYISVKYGQKCKIWLHTCIWIVLKKKMSLQAPSIPCMCVSTSNTQNLVRVHNWLWDSHCECIFMLMLSCGQCDFSIYNLNAQICVQKKNWSQLKANAFNLISQLII